MLLVVVQLLLLLLIFVELLAVGAAHIAALLLMILVVGFVCFWCKRFCVSCLTHAKPEQPPLSTETRSIFGSPPAHPFATNRHTRYVRHRTESKPTST
jgi:hypothetical protein